jgi:MFS family permease
LALGLFGITGGFLVERLGARVLLTVGTWVLFNGAVVLHLAGVDWSPAGIAALYAVIASGYGLVNAAVMQAATRELPEESAGIGSGVYTLFFFLGGAVSVALSGAILRAREAAPEAWNPLFEGSAVEFSDAVLVVVGLAALGFLLAMLVTPQPQVLTPAKPWPLAEAAGGGLQPRAKPNKGNTG